AARRRPLPRAAPTPCQGTVPGACLDPAARDGYSPSPRSLGGPPVSYRPDDVRNVALVGAGGCGKTTLVETALFLAKAVSREGTVEEGNTASDYDPDERERRQSLTATPLHLPWAGKRLQVIDTPGAQGYVGEA